MDWLDWWDDIFSGGSGGAGGEGGGAGRGSFAQFSLSEWSSQVPYIGQYLGFYLAGYEDLSDLTNVPDGGLWSSGEADDRQSRHQSGAPWMRTPAFEIGSVGVDGDADTGGSRRGYLKEFGIDDGVDGSLLRNPNLLADNSPRRVSDEPWMTAPSTPVWSGQENSIDLGGPLRAPWQGPPDEVIVRGVRPDRSKSPPPPMPVPLPSPVRAPYRAPESRPERQTPQRPEAAPPVQWTQEIVISAEPNPFDREESDPEALALAEGRGRIEWGDIVQFGRGGYNGLISAGQQLARLGAVGVGGPGLGPIVLPYVENSIREADQYKLSIDPRYGGAGIVGEQLIENLAFEGLPLVPQLGKLASRALRSERLAIPAFWFLSAGGVGGSSRLSRALRLASRERRTANRLVSISEQATGFRSVSDPSKTYVHLGDTPARTDRAWGVYQVETTGSPVESVIGIVDDNGRLVGSRQLDTSLQGLIGPVPEAKYGDMGQLYNPERYEHIVGQSHFLIDFAQSTGRPGVQYRVSTELGATRLITIFTDLHPEHLRSGFLNVRWYPVLW